MSNNTITLTTEIKKSLHSVDYPFLILGSFVISIIGLFQMFGYNPDLLNSSFEKHLGFTLSMTGFIIALIIGMVVGMGIAEFYKPRVLRYVNVPKDIETISDGLIGLGSFVSFMENITNSRQIARVFLNISRRFTQIIMWLKAHDQRIEKLENTVKDLSKKLKEKESNEKLIKKFQSDLQNALSSIAKSKEKIAEIKKEIKKLKGDKEPEL